MALLLKCGAIFLHVPKTGGSFISELLEKNGLVFANVGEIHCSMDHIHAFEQWFRVSHKYAKPNPLFFKFCFVRHPLKWIESWYKYMRARNWMRWGTDPNIWHPCSLLDGLGAEDFNAFAGNLLRTRPGYVGEMYSRYATQGIHFVGRQECMIEDLTRVLRILGVEIAEQDIRAFRPVNVSDPIEIQWQDDLKRSMEMVESAAMQRFGYTADFGTCEIAEGLEKVPFQSTRLSGPFVNEGGFAWICAMPQFAEFADCLADPYRSSLRLDEDGQAMSPHSEHDCIRNNGGALFSHWNDCLIFSTTDNSDPNLNGREYSFKFDFSAGNRAWHAEAFRVEPAAASCPNPSDDIGRAPDGQSHSPADQGTV